VTEIELLAKIEALEVAAEDARQIAIGIESHLLAELHATNDAFVTSRTTAMMLRQELIQVQSELKRQREYVAKLYGQS